MFFTIEIFLVKNDKAWFQDNTKEGRFSLFLTFRQSYFNASGEINDW
jgi:hypothetical protein